MSGPATPSPDASAEYETIAAALAATERGRWFLAEHGRRNRGADTEMLLGAITRLERTVTADRGHEAFGHLRGNLVDMADAISRTKAEIAAISATNTEQTRLTQASLALDAIVRETEQATSDILGSAESIQEAAWTLRERGADAQACDTLDRHATAIYTACSFQDLTAQRTARIVYTLRYLEDRLSAMIAIWGSEAAPIPSPPGAPDAAAEPADLCQSDIDRYIGMDVPAVTAAALVARPGSPPLHEDLVFLPVSDGREAEAAAAIDGVAESEPVAEAPVGDDPELDWAALVAATPLPAPAGEEPALSFAEIDALPPEQRLALFA
ncbi:hypothetical protein MMSR116_25400 [Methylobacterium mesophilicum SR1.6/6]|uniref:Chemotaxis protein n=1 Tax=Methylobacterium mesophilicum SR1.6/6 TaxID=908290 RepID=A0A6B9FVF7_9HYPH|nr:hypothetical protein [Methylobacterium mesophilicum]QGY04865.1 hypothetical protein MMSR116_25400 [Methylobacterium mesophilicum SR1.6/6]